VNVIRIRLSHPKSGALRYTGNLDMQKVWERAFRRARLPLAYSQGFHPQPRINQACPLPLGFTSTAELLDVWLTDEVPLDQVKTAVETAIPDGLKIRAIETVDLHAPALQTQVDTADYVITLHQAVEPSELHEHISELMASPAVMRERRGKMYNLRPLIVAMRILEPVSDSIKLFLTLTVREGATGRPEEVLLALGLDPFAATVERTQLRLKDLHPEPL